MSTATETAGFTTFATAIGECGLAWGDRGLLAVTLPGGDRERTRRRLAGVAGGAGEQPAPPDVQEAIEGISNLLAGAPAELAGVALDPRGVGEFDRRVAAGAREIAVGATLTYGELAERICAPGQAREVGQALARNRFPIVVPCHRVVAADGGLGGFSAPGGVETKRRLLAIERAHAPGPPALF